MTVRPATLRAVLTRAAAALPPLLASLLAVLLAARVANAEPAGRANAAAPPSAFWQANGEVEALALSGNTLYIGGDFSQLSPRTGPLVAFSATNGQLVRFPTIGEGVVESVVDDGRGGWFVGGSFKAIGGVRCANLAHVTSHSRVDRGWCPKPRGEIVTLARRGSTLFVGGDLGRIGGKSRRTLAALSARSGRALSWNPDPGYFVDDVEVHGRTVFVLGSFRELGKRQHGALAAIDAITGRIHDWNPNPPIDEHNDPLFRRLAVTDSLVYAGGASLVAYDRRTGRQIAWNPLPDGHVAAMNVASGRLVVGGIFGRAAGARRTNLASFDAATGRLTRWAPRARAVSALSATGRLVYAATEDGVVIFDADARRLPKATGAPNAPVRTLAVSDTKVVAGGRFDGIGGVNRSGLAAIDIRTGRPTAWDPRLSGGTPRNAVYTIVVHGSSVYIGGLFERAGGQPRRGLAAVSAATGRPTAWNPKLDGERGYAVVYSLATSEDTLYVGGEFESALGEERFGNASYELTGGRLTDWYPVHGSWPLIVTGETVVLGGREQLTAVDTSNGARLKWRTDLNVFRVPRVDALAISGGVVYFGGFFERAGGASRDGLAAVDSASGELRTWNPRGEHTDFNRALAVDGNDIYAGSFAGLSVLDATTGSRRHTYPSLVDERVDAIVIHGGNAYVGTEHGLVVVPASRR